MLIFRLSCQSSRADPSSDRLIHVRFSNTRVSGSLAISALPSLPSFFPFFLSSSSFFYEYKRVRALVSSTIISIMRLMVKCKSFNKCNIVRPSQKSVRNRECTDLLRGSRFFRDVAGYLWSCRRESPRVLRARLCDRWSASNASRNWSNCIRYTECISLSPNPEAQENIFNTQILLNKKFDNHTKEIRSFHEIINWSTPNNISKN